jgi:hypothetical protein
MNTLPFFLLLTADGKPLTGEQAHAILSMVLRRDLSLAWLRKTSVSLAADESQDIASLFSQSDSAQIYRWATELVLSIRNKLGTGVIYVVIRFQSKETTITVLSHSKPENAVLPNGLEISRVAESQVRAKVEEVLKTPSPLRDAFLLQRKMGKMLASRKPAGGQKQGNGIPSDSGGIDL